MSDTLHQQITDALRAKAQEFAQLKAGLELVRDWSDGMSEYVWPDEIIFQPSWFYTCDVYDPLERRCTDYDNRPEPCRGFPWYGGQPETIKNLRSSCSRTGGQCRSCGGRPPTRPTTTT